MIDKRPSVTGEVDPPAKPCTRPEPHGAHPWLEEAEPPGIGNVARRCLGRPGVAASFPDYRWVLSVRCFATSSGGEQCRRLLVFERPDGEVEMSYWQGWRMSETGRAGYANRVWTCPEHQLRHEPLTGG